MRELFPIPRSLTGEGVRDTLAVLGARDPARTRRDAVGTQVFDWTVPREWKLRGAWIDGPDGERVLDVADSPLHVLGYSIPVDAVLTLDELRDHVFTHRDDPELVPYRTSYWEEQWGFCMSRRQLDALEEGDYRVVIDAEPRGRLAHLGRGATSPVQPTPSSCSAPTSAIRRSPTTTSPASSSSGRSPGRSAEQQLTHTYRLLWSPGTLGPLCWLDREPRDARSRAARARRVVRRRPRAAAVQAEPARRRTDRSCRGVRPRRASRRASSPTGSRPAATSASSARPASTCPSAPCHGRRTGSFPSTTPRRTTSTLVTPKRSARRSGPPSTIIDLRRDERAGTATGRRTASRSSAGAASTRASPTGRTRRRAFLWVLNLSDGDHDLLAIAERSGLPFETIRDAAETLERHELLEERPRRTRAGRGRHRGESGDRPGDSARAWRCRIRRRPCRQIGGGARGDASCWSSNGEEA